MEVEIGNAAGTIWRSLDQHGQLTLRSLKQETKLSDQLLFMGVGWLAREGKLTFIQDTKDQKISLREAQLQSA